jgi:hypothetical protein
MENEQKTAPIFDSHLLAPKKSFNTVLGRKVLAVPIIPENPNESI